MEAHVASKLRVKTRSHFSGKYLCGNYRKGLGEFQPESLILRLKKCGSTAFSDSRFRPTCH